MHSNQQLAALRKTYASDRAVFIPGGKMRPLLLSLGASEADFDSFEKIGEDLKADPTLPFRRSRSGRFLIDHKMSTISRGEKQGFVLTADEDFVRHDSGQVREFADIDVFQNNTVLHALLRFQSRVTDGIDVVRRRGLNYENDVCVSTVFALRTVSRPELVGEPALEGVHTDGVDHTMTTMLATCNVDGDSGRTYLHDMRERTGAQWNDTSSELVLGSVHHRDFLDTLLVIDNERKHSVTPVSALDGEREATRDMMIFFTRQPASATHPSSRNDSLLPHSDRPLTLPLHLPSDD